jgi:hypothetical protein
MATVPTDVILVRCKFADAQGLLDAARHFCSEAGLGLVLERAAWSPDSHWTYVYAQLTTPHEVEAASLPLLRRIWSDCCPAAQDVDLSRLQRMQDLPGAAEGATPIRHYVVETDAEPDWQDEIVRWYIEEHLPGLAAVPGTVRAQRFVNHDSGPRSHACYGLATEEAFNSPPWLAVRGTEWSSRVRPHFTNTRRTMMDVVG